MLILAHESLLQPALVFSLKFDLVCPPTGFYPYSGRNVPGGAEIVFDEEGDIYFVSQYHPSSYLLITKEKEYLDSGETCLPPRQPVGRL